MKRTFTTEEIRDLLDSEHAVRVSVGPWRHGHTETHVFAADDGHHYRITIHVHTDDGWQLYADKQVCERVKPVQVTETQWVPWDGDNDG